VIISASDERRDFQAYEWNMNDPERITQMVFFFAICPQLIEHRSVAMCLRGWSIALQAPMAFGHAQEQALIERVPDVCRTALCTLKCEER
jgi:hypothetical protein